MRTKSKQHKITKLTAKLKPDREFLFALKEKTGLLVHKTRDENP
jgi:hypothetical protein